MNNIEKLKNLQQTENLDYIVIKNPSNLYYFSNFLNADAWIFCTKNEIYYITDARYAIEAMIKVQGMTVIVESNAIAFIEKNTNNNKNVGIEFNIKHSDFVLLENVFTPKKIIDIKDLIKIIRSVKDDFEIDCIKKAVSITESALKKITLDLNENVTEKEISTQLEYEMKKLGCDNLAFDSIVAFGENSAKPHHSPTHRKLKYGDFIIIDCGSKFKGYCSDITRTFVYGKVDESKEKIYNIVKEANLFGISILKQGISASLVDSEVRSYLKKHELSEYFVHSLGHGVGLDIHEFPFLKNGTLSLVKGNVITIEPGVYIENEFGVRIEDSVLVKENSCEILTSFEKNLIVL